ncbi:MAG TPA: hypothetical protein VE439_09265 [Anaerolineae bacterium]|nr:hypothetical protein [Anaerolineae bacterium]
MDWDRDLLEAPNRENGLTRVNRAIYRKLLECQVPAMIAAKPAYHLAEMYIQALDFNAKANELIKLTETTDFAEKILEMREAVKSLRHFSERFGRGYYTLMDRVNALTENWLDEEIDRDNTELAEGVEEMLEDLKSSDLKAGMRDEVRAHQRQQYSTLVKRLISKGCSEDVSNYFADNLFELKSEASNLISLVDRLVSADGDFENLIFNVEEILIEISIPWVGFSPGETAHALWHMGDHDEDNFFFMGFLGWSLAILENLQENIEDL